jgi:hypothetical protein
LGIKHHGLDYTVNHKQVCIAFNSQNVIAAATRITASKILQDDRTYALPLDSAYIVVMNKPHMQLQYCFIAAFPKHYFKV